MTELARGCHHCEPRVRISKSRLGPSHYSANLGDYDKVAMLDGQPVKAAEVVVGTGGWAIMLPDGEAHRCSRCSRGAEWVRVSSPKFTVQ